MTNNITDNPILDTPVISPNSSYYKIKSGKVKAIATADDSLILAEPSSHAMSDSQYCKTTVTECGHVIELDSTPGAERICVFHKDGNFVEMSKNGMTTKVFGKDFEIVLDDKALSVAGKLNITVQGDCNLLVGGNATTKIQGNEERFIRGDSTTYVKGIYTVKSEKTLQLESTQNITTKSRGTTILYSASAFDIISNSSLTLQAGNSSFNIASSGTAALNVTNYNLLARGNISNEALGNISTLANGSISGSEYASVSISTPSPAMIPTSQNITFGLGFSTSLMEPSAADMFLNKSDSASALFLQDPLTTYPKDRTKI